VIVQSHAVDQNLYEIVSEIKNTLQPDDLRIEEHLSQIAVVGREMRNRPGMSGALLSEFGNHAINIRTISQSCDELTIVVGVNDSDFEKAIHAIYDKFISEEKNK
ncbi:MAG: ACT domain-containing protein, partial [Lactimicrobium massiliense]